MWTPGWAALVLLLLGIQISLCVPPVTHLRSQHILRMRILRYFRWLEPKVGWSSFFPGQVNISIPLVGAPLSIDSYRIWPVMAPLVLSFPLTSSFAQTVFRAPFGLSRKSIVMVFRSTRILWGTIPALRVQDIDHLLWHIKSEQCPQIFWYLCFTWLHFPWT